MWELVIAIGISIPNSPNIKVEEMPDKNTCFEVLDKFKIKQDYNSKNEGQTFIYCRPQQINNKGK